MSEKIEIKWNEGMSFEAEVNGHKLIIDAVADVGGKDLGPRPKPLTLVSLGGCTGMDVISILKKMRIEPDYFNVEISAEMTDEHPRYYNKIHLDYIFRGDNLPMEKLEKAVNLSQERYCGVTAMLAKAAVITHDIKVNS